MKANKRPCPNQVEKWQERDRVRARFLGIDWVAPLRQPIDFQSLARKILVTDYEIEN